jgi:hypothetical protein
MGMYSTVTLLDSQLMVLKRRADSPERTVSGTGAPTALCMYLIRP